jgi:2-phosphoglycerate kinase
MRVNKIIFIIGVNGVGKSAVIEPLKSLLNSSFEIHDFDERGVPDNVQRQWRLYETKYWIELGRENIKKNISTIICGFVKPSEIEGDSSIKLVLLDADGETIEKRLRSRYPTPDSIKKIERTVGKTVQKFIGDNVWFSSKLREEAQRYGLGIVDTSALTPEEVAQEVVKKLN